MYEFYEKQLSQHTSKVMNRDLKNVYDSIPETTGCMENIHKEGGCGSWCCEKQSPSLFFSEFLYTWKRIESSWGKAKLAALALRCVETYLSDIPTKGCVFWDRGSKLCQIHDPRPFNCRAYGQIPEEEFKPRYERLKILYENTPNANVCNQCNLVKSEKPPTKADMDGWFKELQYIELDVGIHPSLMNDGDGGSYRQFHDHILLKIGSPAFLEKLAKLRLKGTQEDKAKFIETFSNDLQRDLKI